MNKFILTLFAIFTLSFLLYQNKIYAYDNSDNLVLTKEVIADKSWENRVVEYNGTVSGVYKNDYGIISVYFKNQNLGKKLTLNIMPNLGFTLDLKKGDFIKAVGIIKPGKDKYKDVLQLQPLDKDSVIILEKLPEINLCENGIDMQGIEKNIGSYANIANFQMYNKREFKSKKGEIHFSFNLVKNGTFYNAIIFANNYKKLKELINNNQNFCANVKITRYKNDISLQIENLSPYKK